MYFIRNKKIRRAILKPFKNYDVRLNFEKIDEEIKNQLENNIRINIKYWCIKNI